MFDREAAERFARKSRADSDKRKAEAALMEFVQRDGLEVAVAEQIVPTLVQIKRGRNVVGIGFYQHERWLVFDVYAIHHMKVSIFLH